MADKILIKIGSLDLTPFINSYKVDYNVLIKDEGRNAAGNSIINITNRKVKLSVGFIPLNEDQMATLLSAISTFEVNVQYWDIQTKSQLTKLMYISTPSPEFYSNANQTGVFKDLFLSFIEE